MVQNNHIPQNKANTKKEKRRTTQGRGTQCDIGNVRQRLKAVQNFVKLLSGQSRQTGNFVSKWRPTVRKENWFPVPKAKSTDLWTSYLTSCSSGDSGDSSTYL